MHAQLKSFIDRNPDAAMVTLRRDGAAHMARIEVAVVDGLWSSGSPDLMRTRNLRRDPRCSLFVFAPPPDPQWVGLETEVSMLDGSDAAHLHLRLMRVRHKDRAPTEWIVGHDEELERDRPLSEDEYVERIRSEKRPIYEFSIERACGITGRTRRRSFN